jgi:hypothetical protein|tara:strand:- start:1276 stop:1491 length:216 start_codon:yes stop_codon:yes gene_type:complete
MSKAWKVYSPKLNKFYRNKNMQGLIWERKSAAKRCRTRFINEYNLPNDALEIIEYDLSETRRYKHNQMNEL